MTWFKVDDKAAFHKKVMKAGNEAFGAFVRMGCWSSDHLTDGRIPIETASVIATEHVLQKLCSIGFLEPDGDDFVIHDFLEYNPSAAKVEAERQRKREAGKKGAANRWGNGKTNGTCHSTSHGTSYGTAAIGSSDAPDPDPLKAYTRARAEGAKCDPTKLQDAWMRHTGHIMAGSLVDIAVLCEQAAAAQDPPLDPNAYAEKAISAFVDWAAKCPPGRRPQLSTPKFVEHFPRIQDFVSGSRSRPKGSSAIAEATRRNLAARGDT